MDLEVRVSNDGTFPRLHRNNTILSLWTSEKKQRKAASRIFPKEMYGVLLFF